MKNEEFWYTLEKLINFNPKGIIDISVKTSAKGNNYLTLVISENNIDKETIDRRWLNAKS